MPISRTTKNDGHAHVELRRTIAELQRRMKVRINVGNSPSTPGIADTDNTAVSSGLFLTAGQSVTVAYRITGETNIVAVGETFTFRIGIKLMRDDADANGASAGSFVQYVSGGDKEITFPGTEELTPSENNDTGDAQAAGTFTFTAPSESGFFKCILVVDNVGTATPATTDVTDGQNEFYADSDGYFASSGGIGNPPYNVINERGSAGIRIGVSITNLSTDIVPNQGYTKSPTLTVTHNSTINSAQGSRVIRLGVITPSQSNGTAAVKTFSVTLPTAAGAVTTSTYNIDTQFPLAVTVHRIRAAVGPAMGNSSTTTAELPDFWETGNGTSAPFNGNDLAWTWLIAGADTSLNDSSGNGLTLTKNGSPTLVTATQTKYAGGWGNFASSNYLSQSDSSLRISGNLSYFVSFKINSAADQVVFACSGNTQLTLGDDSANNILYQCAILSDGTIQVMHRFDDGNNELIQSAPGVCGTGNHTFTYTRNSTTKTVLVKLDGVTAINTTYSNNATGGSNAILNIGRMNSPNDGFFPLLGEIYELRIWDTLVDQSVLDEIASSSDPDYTSVSQGTERGLWFMNTMSSLSNYLVQSAHPFNIGHDVQVSTLAMDTGQGSRAFVRANDQRLSVTSNAGLQAGDVDWFLSSFITNYDLSLNTQWVGKMASGASRIEYVLECNVADGNRLKLTVGTVASGGTSLVSALVSSFISESCSDRPTTVIGSPATVASPWTGFGNALDFPGTNNGDNTAGISSGVIQFSGTQPFTVEARVRPEGDSGTVQIIISSAIANSGLTDGDQYALYLSGSPRKASFDVVNGSNGFSTATSTTTISNNTNYVIRGVFDGSNVRIFVNGTLEATVAFSGVIKPGDGVTPLTIGRDNHGNATNSPFPFNGIIDEVRVSNVARSLNSYTVDPIPFACDQYTVGLWHFDEAAPGAIEKGRTYHLFAWHDKTADTINLTVNNTYTVSTSISGGTFAGTDPFCIGGFSSNFGADRRVSGHISRVTWGKPPTAIGSLISTVRTSLYNSGSGKLGSQITTQERTDWGITDHWDLNEYVAVGENEGAVPSIGSDTLVPTNAPRMAVAPNGTGSFSLFNRGADVRMRFTFKDAFGVPITPGGSTTLYSLNPTNGILEVNNNDTGSPFYLAHTSPSTMAAFFDFVGSSKNLRVSFTHYGSLNPTFTHQFSPLGLDIYRVTRRMGLSTISSSVNRRIFTGTSASPATSQIVINRGQSVFFNTFLTDCRGQPVKDVSQTFGVRLARDTTSVSNIGNFTMDTNGQFTGPLATYSAATGAPCGGLALVLASTTVNTSNQTRSGEGGLGNYGESLNESLIQDVSGRGLDLNLASETDNWASIENRGHSKYGHGKRGFSTVVHYSNSNPIFNIQGDLSMFCAFRIDDASATQHLLAFGGSITSETLATNRSYGIYFASTNNALLDSSGNNFTLTQSGSPRQAICPKTKYETGWTFRADSHFLSTTAVTPATIIGNLSITMAFSIDSLEGGYLIYAHTAAGSPNTNTAYQILLNGNGTIRYAHEHGAGIDTLFTSTETISLGFHTLTLRRDATSTTKSIVIKIDGVTFIDQTYANNPTDSGGTRRTAIFTDAFSPGNTGPNGSVYEVRIWNSLVAQSILDKIADPEDSDYTNTPEGTETACWFLNHRLRLDYVHESGSGTDVVVGSTTLVGPGNHTLTLRRNSNTKIIVVKVDGVTVLDNTLAPYATNPDGGTSGLLRIGVENGGSTTFENGSIYELRIWNSLVSQATLDIIADPTNSTGGAFSNGYTGTLEGSELACWFFSGDGTTTVPDSGNKNFDGRICYGSTSGSGVDPKASNILVTSGTGIQFDGANANINIAQGVDICKLNLHNLSAFTIEARFMLTSNPNTQPKAIISRYSPSNDPFQVDNFWFGVLTSSGLKMHCHLAQPDGSFALITGSTTIELNVPYMSALTWDGTTARILLKRGRGTAIQEGTVAITNVPDQGPESLRTWIGRSDITFTTDQHGFPGIIDELRISNDDRYSIEASGLQTMLSAIGNGTAVTSLIPTPFDFSMDGSGGETGNSINDGGNDMYDGGNFLSTDLVTNFSYTGSQVLFSSNIFGAGSAYFTKKYSPGLFAMVAGGVSISTFKIDGNLGADGTGSMVTSTLTTNVDGQEYTIYYKSVFGTTDPSVNHLIVIPGNGSGITRTTGSTTDSDLDQLVGLGDISEIYYLLVARTTGQQLSTADAVSIVNQFLSYRPEGGLTTGANTAAFAPSADGFTADGNTLALYKFDEISGPEWVVTATGKLAHHLQVDDSELNPTLNRTDRLVTKIGYYGVKATDVNGVAYNGATGSLSLRDDRGQVSAVTTSGLTTAQQTSTYGTFSGYTTLQPWTNQIPDGGWDLWASTDGSTNSTFTHNGNTFRLMKQELGFFDFVVKASNLQLRTFCKGAKSGATGNFVLGDTFFFGFATLDIENRIPIACDENGASASIVVFRQFGVNAGYAEYLDENFEWQRIENETEIYSFPLTETEAGVSRVYSNTIPGGVTLTWGNRHPIVIGKAVIAGVAYASDTDETIPGGGGIGIITRGILTGGAL